MASIGSWADICEEELGHLEIKDNTPKEAEATPSTPEPKQKEEEKKEEKGKEEETAPPKKNLFDEVEKLHKAVHADVTAAVEHDPKNPPEKEPKEIESFYDLKSIKPALFQTIVTSGFDRPSPVQARALPIAFSGRNLIAQAPSGTGKTITFTLSLLQNIDETKNYPQAVVVSPTLDLAHAIHRIVSVYADALGMKTQLVIKEMTSLKYKNAQVIVGTPGKLTSCFRRAGPMFIDPSRISVFVLDEADKMLQANGLGNETRRVLSCCKNIKQFILCSATFQKSVLDFAIGSKGIIRGPWSMVKIVPRGSGKCAIPKTIRHFFFMLKDGGQENKIEALLTLYSVITVGQSFVFTNTKSAVKEISNRMNREGMHSVALSGELTMEQRMEMFRQFHALEKRICVSTNVGSRGLDITGCTTVINFDIPYEDMGQTIPDVPTYVHRAGRSGRYGRNGICVTMVTSRKEYEDMKQIFEGCVSTDGVEIQWDEWSLEEIEEIEEQLTSLAEE